MKLIIDIDENVYTRLFDNGIQDNEIATDDICEMARALRLGTPQDEWIPVSERLPEEGKSVLVCIKTQGGISQFVSERFNDNIWSALVGRTPIAWKPLPEPYKEAKLKPTKDLINDIVGFDVSTIKPLPEYKESETENEQD